MTNTGREIREPGWLSPDGVTTMRVEPPALGECRVLRGPYLGDVSALCFLPSTPLPYLIAGSIVARVLIVSWFLLCIS